MYKSAFLFFFLLASPAADAANVVQIHYGYEYDGARDMGSDHEFVVCDSCPHTPPVFEMPPLKVAFRFNSIGREFTSDREKASGPVSEFAVEYTGFSEYRLEKTVLFGFNSANISDERALRFFAKGLADDNTVSGIRVRGFTCDLGAKAYNNQLAINRAKAVADIIVQEGLKKPEVTGEGKCCYAAGKRENSRRVEISVLRLLRAEKAGEK